MNEDRIQARRTLLINNIDSMDLRPSYTKQKIKHKDDIVNDEDGRY